MVNKNEIELVSSRLNAVVSLFGKHNGLPYEEVAEAATRVAKLAFRSINEVLSESIITRDSDALVKLRSELRNASKRLASKKIDPRAINFLNKFNTRIWVLQNLAKSVHELLESESPLLPELVEGVTPLYEARRYVAGERKHMNSKVVFELVNGHLAKAMIEQDAKVLGYLQIELSRLSDEITDRLSSKGIGKTERLALRGFNAGISILSHQATTALSQVAGYRLRRHID